MPCPFRQFPLLAVGIAALVSGCKPPAAKTSAALSEESGTGLAKQLAAAKIDAAKSKAPDEALALLVSALGVDPVNQEARDAAARLLSETTWNWPVVSLQHRLPIDQLAFSPPSSLWVSLSGTANTTVRWDLESLNIAKVLFPTSGAEKTRALVFDPTHRSMVVQRAGVSVLCNAQTLKPIRDLGQIPENFTPAAAIAYSPDGLLVAHPAHVSEKDRSIVWHLKDAASGEIIRTSEPAPQSLAAFLDRRDLRILQADGSIIEMPLSPVESIVTTPPAEPMKLLHAQFSADGTSALVSEDRGPHQPPALTTISFGDEDDGSLTQKALAERFPWSRQPNLWNGLMRDQQDPLVHVDGRELEIRTSPHALVRGSSTITSAAISDKLVILGEENGDLVIHRFLPLPAKVEAVKGPVSLDLSALRNLAAALSGTRYDEAAREFKSLDPATRLAALDACDFKAIQAIFPDLDFTPVSTAIRETPHRSAHAGRDAAALGPARFGRCDGESWPAILAVSKDLSATPWHQQLTAAVVGNLAKTPFAEGDDAAILEAIRSAGPKGPAAAKALAMALASEHPEWIAASLDQATDLPPLLRKIAKSRMAWLDGRKADALSGWPENFPTMAEFRLREDWEGWEQADFSPALENLRQCVADELLALVVPEDSTAEQRKAIADRLKDPATMAAIGKPRFAHACLQAALAFSAFKEDKELTFQLANLARQLGAPPEPCLRAEALALTALGEYTEAHPRWITLITEHPVETHIPGDYAEAAYTAFENADPRQAMEILTTGIHRFPNDGNFAIRAGWVALLTGNSERAYQFLQSGQRVGFPAEKLENATALLAIAAAQSGATDDAAVYFNDLLKISPDWADPSTVETLEWPEELKATLRQLTF